jgi:diguanylate cyclase (GGDEF)-like protein
MATSLHNISMQGWLKLTGWTFFGTLGCLVVSLVFNWLAFRDMSGEALRQGMISAMVLPIMLAGPLFFYLTLKLRELAVANHRLNDLASTDSLTGCLNRRAFTVRVERELETTDCDGRAARGALLVLDADHFKAINDLYGHDRGDEALRLIARATKSALRAVDVVGRLGGEEFGVYLPGANLTNAVEISERIRCAVSSVVFMPSKRKHALSVSVGCAAFERPVGFRELFQIADESLYAAKGGGRNRVEIVAVPPLEPDLVQALKAL